MVQFSHPYMIIGKCITLTRRTFVGKVMSLLFNMLSRLLIAFLPRSKHTLISWLQSPSAVILEPKKIKSITLSIVSHLFAMKWWDQMPWSQFSECWVLSQLFHSITFIITFSSISAIRVVMKRTSFFICFGLVLEALVCLHRTVQLQLLQH